MSLILYLVLVTVVCIQTINGQTIRSHIICDVDEVIVNVNSSGVIQHVQRDSSISCTLLLSGFVSGGYVSIPGVNPKPSFGCEQYTTVTINNVPYCVRGTQSNNQVIVKLTNDQLNIILPSADVPDFELNYYSNVAVCGTDLKIPDGAEVNQLSGVTSSSYDPQKLIIPATCTVRVIDLPRTSVSVRFELLYTSLPFPLYIRDEQFTSSENKGSTLLVATDSERDIYVNYTATELVDMSFVLNFTVLHCGDIPAIHVPYSTNSTTATPWLPGSMVTYVCVDEWKLKYDTNSTIECIVDISREIAVWSDHSNIQCIPEPWCHSPPNAIDTYSTYILSEDNLTATYQCIDGYATNSAVSDRIINCTTSDRDTTPWTWSSPPSFVCAPVECNLASEYQNITNGEVTDKRYYYTQQLQYQCDVGYMKGEVVECTSDGSWSALPVCVPIPSTTSTASTTSTSSTTSTTSIMSATSVKGALQLSGEELIITVSASASGGLVLLVAIAVIGACLYRLRARNSGPKTATNEVTSSTEQEPDVPLDSVDEVSPFTTTPSLSPTSFPAASNYPDNRNHQHRRTQESVIELAPTSDARSQSPEACLTETNNNPGEADSTYETVRKDSVQHIYEPIRMEMKETKGQDSDKGDPTYETTRKDSVQHVYEPIRKEIAEGFTHREQKEESFDYSYVLSNATPPIPHPTGSRRDSSYDCNDYVGPDRC